jgi:molybdopterin synthase catalytic subunit
MIEISVLFFATLKEKIGAPHIQVELTDGATVGDLRSHLMKTYQHAAPVLKNSLVSINQEYAFDEEALPKRAEAAFFPPVSGGGDGPTIVKITTEALDFDDLLAKITLDSTGAACVFSGMVRGVTKRGDAHETSFLEYEAYVPMAEAKMRQVADEIRSRWPSVEGIVIVQRIGHLDPKTPTVIIGCSAAHHDTGVFEAARYGIDRLKQIVPIWKKEVTPGGEAWVEGDYQPTPDDR